MIKVRQHSYTHIYPYTLYNKTWNYKWQNKNFWFIYSDPFKKQKKTDKLDDPFRKPKKNDKPDNTTNNKPLLMKSVTRSTKSTIIMTLTLNIDPLKSAYNGHSIVSLHLPTETDFSFGCVKLLDEVSHYPDTHHGPPNEVIHAGTHSHTSLTSLYHHMWNIVHNCLIFGVFIPNSRTFCTIHSSRKRIQWFVEYAVFTTSLANELYGRRYTMTGPNSQKCIHYMTQIRLISLKRAAITVHM